MRKKTLWRMLYETAARANEVLALNVEDLDVGARRAVVSCMKPKTSTAPTKPWDDSPTSTATGQIPEYEEVVGTIVAWGEDILAYHTSRRATNGPIEGINNLLQVLHRRGSRVHQHQQCRSPRSPRNMTPHTDNRARTPSFRRSLKRSAYY